jgi:hypothetical protein
MALPAVSLMLPVFKGRSVVLLSMARREVIKVASQSPVQVMSTAMAWMI